MLRRLFLLIFLVLFVSSSTVICASKFNRVGFPVIVKDDLGYEFKMKKQPEKIISTMPSITEMLFSINLGGKIIGVTEFCDYPEEAKKIPKIGRDKINLEKGVSLEADLIVMLGDAQQKDIERFRKFNQPVFVINPHTIRDVFADYDKLGIITGNSHAAYKITEWMKRKINWKEAQAKSSRYYNTWTAMVLVSKRPVVVAGKDNFIDDMLRTIGVRNVINSNEPYPTLGKEQILTLDPDIIITTTDIAKKPQDIYNDSKFKKTKAGINKRVLVLDPDIISRPGPRLVNGLEEMFNFIYGVPASDEVRSEKS